uniref:Uncharacterized protein n=1 Tax=Opuntia streptacantha TaxID=393608 RepID=A0A7C8ZW17_OPUST
MRPGHPNPVEVIVIFNLNFICAIVGDSCSVVFKCVFCFWVCQIWQIDKPKMCPVPKLDSCAIVEKFSDVHTTLPPEMCRMSGGCSCLARLWLTVERESNVKR